MEGSNWSPNKYMAKVEVKLGITKNMGDFNSVRYDVSLSLEGERGTEDQMYQEANEWVAKKIEEFQK